MKIMSVVVDLANTVRVTVLKDSSIKLGDAVICHSRMDKGPFLMC